MYFKTIDIREMSFVQLSIEYICSVTGLTDANDASLQCFENVSTPATGVCDKKCRFPFECFNTTFTGHFKVVGRSNRQAHNNPVDIIRFLSGTFFRI